MKLLFLDIDGVLNSLRSEVVNGKEKSVENIDDISLGLVQKVVKKSGCIVVLSSNWRFTHYLLDLGRRLDLPIIYQTPSREDNDRQKEIEDFINSFGKIDAYAVLDDLPLDMKNLVKVDGENGISYDNYKQLIELLE